MIRFYIFCFITLLNTLFSVEKPFVHFPHITVFDGQSRDLMGPSEELIHLKTFHFNKYKIYDVNGLGSFYIDYHQDTIKNTLARGQLWESNIVELIKKYIRPGTIAIDIGSHIGTHLISMSRAVGENGYVLGFEPQMKLFSELVMNMNINQIDNVVVYQCALGRNFDQIQMNVAYTNNEGGTAIGKGGDLAPLIPLDAFNLSSVSLIKIDVEGYEDEVLAGAEETIRKNHPCIIIELMDSTENLVKKQDATIKNLESMGYTVTKLWGWDWFAIPKK